MKLNFHPKPAQLLFGYAIGYIDQSGISSLVNFLGAFAYLFIAMQRCCLIREILSLKNKLTTLQLLFPEIDFFFPDHVSSSNRIHISLQPGINFHKSSSHLIIVVKMKNISLKYSIVFLSVLAGLALEFSACHKIKTSPASPPEMMVELGRKLFFDNSLSNPVGQSCATCHSPATAFSDPAHNIVSPGIAAGLFGNRNAPTAMYVKFSPPLHYSVDDSAYVGGLFLDGRVNTLEEQAQKPFLNPLEMGNTDAAMLISKLHGSVNYSYYKQVFGDITDVNVAFANIASAIAAFERSDTLSAFTSKYDYYLKGMATLSPSELNGLNLFNDTLRAMCVNCHLTTPDPASGKILFTDFSYENDGVPRNAYNPYYTIPAIYNLLGLGYVDLGLGDFINDSDNYGTFRTPTLRNVAISAPYFHNGCFGTLEQVVHFYNTRDSIGSGFDAPEYAATIDHAETGNQHLSAQEEADIVAFLKTLTDGYQP